MAEENWVLSKLAVLFAVTAGENWVLSKLDVIVAVLLAVYLCGYFHGKRSKPHAASP